MLEQLDTRLREVEGITIEQVRMPGDSFLATMSKDAARTYDTSVKVKKDAGVKDHGLGSPHVHILASAVDGLLKMGPPESCESSILARFVALGSIRCHMNAQQVHEVPVWAKSFRVSSMYAEAGTVAPARVAFHLEGSALVPTTVTREEFNQLVNASAADQFNFAVKWVEMVDGVPMAPNGPGRAVPIQQLFRTLLCSSGGVVMAGRPPRGRKAYQLRRGGDQPEDEEF